MCKRLSSLGFVTLPDVVLPGFASERMTPWVAGGCVGGLGIVGDGSSIGLSAKCETSVNSKLLSLN